jgi:hypothetical protein
MPPARDRSRSLAGDSQPTITVGAWLLYDIIRVPLVFNPDSGAHGKTRCVAGPRTARAPPGCLYRSPIRMVYPPDA